MDWPEIRNRIELAFKMFGCLDSDLFSGLEGPAQFRIAMYLQGLFPGYHVDCEYGRFGAAIKRVQPNEQQLQEIEVLGLTEVWQQLPARAIYPDIVVHTRKEQTSNLLCLELKSNAFDQSDDVKMLLLTGGVDIVARAGAQANGNLIYNFGLQVNLNLIMDSNEAEARLWKNGKIIDTPRLPY
jgi:hypothetical protein